MIVDVDYCVSSFFNYPRIQLIKRGTVTEI